MIDAPIREINESVQWTVDALAGMTCSRLNLFIFFLSADERVCAVFGG
jgi:hypothetical protein